MNSFTDKIYNHPFVFAKPYTKYLKIEEDLFFFEEKYI